MAPGGLRNQKGAAVRYYSKSLPNNQKIIWIVDESKMVDYLGRYYQWSGCLMVPEQLFKRLKR